MTTTTYTPWGRTRDIEELAEGILRVTTPGHGGLKLSRERWEELPAAVRDSMLYKTFAEEDCEEPIVRTAAGRRRRRGQGDGPHGSGLFRAVRPRASVRPLLSAGPPPSRLFLLGRTGLGPPSNGFDTRVEAESFAQRPGDGEEVRADGGRRLHPDGPALSAGRRTAMTTATTRARPRSLPSTRRREAPDGDGQPLRHRLVGRGRRALRGVRMARKGRIVPARRDRTGLPTHLPCTFGGAHPLKR